MSFYHCSKSNPPGCKKSFIYSRLLAVDTATQACSVAISDNKTLMAEIINVTRQTHSRHLLSMIESALSMAQLSLSDLDGFVVTKGPGSFTGLRIGISTVKGLAKAAAKPLLGISYLECLARQSLMVDGLVCALIDARRQEYYYALYRADNSTLKPVLAETVGPLADLIQKIEFPCYFIGNGVNSTKQQLQAEFGMKASFAAGSQNILRPASILDLGQELLEKGCQDDLKNFIPKYVRKSDAQVHLEKCKFNAG